ncbi:MAG: glycosyltransferase [Myxococcota bacterium]|nr:glycosyltransferase [Myxococcota bacterium]
MLGRVRIALVHDWVTGMRGGERVLDVIAQAFPGSDLYTLFYEEGTTSAAIDSLKVEVSPLGRLPGAKRHYRKFLPLYPWAADHFRIEGYDLVLSVSHAVAKNVKVEEGVPHLSYCLTPMRYIWDQIDAYLGRGPRRFLSAPLVKALRRYDRARSHPGRVDRFVAISRTVGDRIEEHYGRSSSVIFPPVDTERICPNGRSPEDFYLLVGGFVPYKHEDIAIEAFRHRKEKLVIVGDGPTRRNLMKGAPSNVEFTGRLPDEELVGYFQRCRALIYPQEEDFGIAAVEAQAAGRPVIALGHGGALDTVRPLLTVDSSGDGARSDETEPTGLYFSEQSPEALARALDGFLDHEEEFATATIRRHAEGFSQERFVRELKAEIARLIES